MIAAAVASNDYTLFHTLNKVLARPYEEQPEHAHLQEAPSIDERVLETFCGT